jgi:hypothetical protein
MLPGQVAGQGLNNQGQVLQNVRTQQQIQSQPLQNAHTQAEIAQAQTQVKNTAFDNVNNLRKQFEAEQAVQDYKTVLPMMSSALTAGNNKAGDLNIVYAFGKVMDPNSVVREGEQVMAQGVGGVADRIRGYLQSINGKGRLDPNQRLALMEEIRNRASSLNKTYDQRRQFYSDFAQRNNINPTDIVGPEPGAPFRSTEEEYIKAHGGTPRDPYAPQAPAAEGDIGFNAPNQPKSPYSAQQIAAYDAFLKANPHASADQLKSFLGSINMPVANADEIARELQQGRPFDPNVSSAANGSRQDVQDLANQYIKQGSGRGAAFATGATDALTAGFGDELGGAGQAAVDSIGGKGSFADRYALNRDALRLYENAQRKQNGGFYLGGQALGGALTGIAGAGGLAKVPALEGSLFGTGETLANGKMANPILGNVLNKQALSGDAAYGGAYGAGSDNDNRLQGAVMGTGLGLGGGAATRGMFGTAASVISPTGGKLAPLYEMGVRPSIGQRVGGIVNNLEEKFQSFPIVGDFIRGTRHRAIDQYQTGLFNDSLGEIGQQLPEGITVGHPAHAFAQNAFNQAYDAAKAGMTVRADKPMLGDLEETMRAVGTLKPDSQKTWQKIWDDSVKRRMVDGTMEGEGYKSATSEIEKKIAAIRSNPNGDGELADALQSASDALKASAMRNSDTRAAIAMGRADRGYAKLVRLENASRTAAGEPAEFSPIQYNNAVRTSSGGVRNREYLRGDALNSDIAALGTQLRDKVSNSGTVDRLVPWMMVGGGAIPEPGLTAATLGAYSLLNAPGIRNATTAAMAPRANPLFNRAAEQLRQRARLAGMFGAPLALDYYGNQ